MSRTKQALFGEGPPENAPAKVLGKGGIHETKTRLRSAAESYNDVAMGITDPPFERDERDEADTGPPPFPYKYCMSRAQVCDRMPTYGVTSTAGDVEMVSHFRRIGESPRRGFAMTGSGVACDRGPRPAAAEWGW